MDRIMEDLRSTEEIDELPGFRFHPTDEELVRFYLRRKLDKKPISIELIKQIDIYKYDPWDLPKASCMGEEKEWYFYCRRGRKYKNSIRPNRVTGSGFWKATGIDKPVYSLAGDCIGLKKTLVYYRGSAGKGTKTDWMMHEFRLPSNNVNDPASNNNNPQEAEIWTLCKIFKRTVTQRKCTPDWTHLASKRRCSDNKNSRSMSINNSNVESCNSTITYDQEAYINFGGSPPEKKPAVVHNYSTSNNHYNDQGNHHVSHHFSNSSSMVAQQPPHQLTASSSSLSPSSSLSFWGNQQQASNELSAFENSWDELESVVQFCS